MPGRSAIPQCRILAVWYELIPYAQLAACAAQQAGSFKQTQQQNTSTPAAAPRPHHPQPPPSNTLYHP
jgi:hypothetical protein